jgi:hypothetical protein
VYGWTKKFGLPLYRVRIHKHNNWGGARPGYWQLMHEFARNSIKIYGVENDLFSKLTWLYGVKEE